MGRLKKWLVETYLPSYAREAMLERCQKLEKENESLRETIREQEEYIAGMQDALRLGKKVVIRMEGSKE